MIPLVFRGSMLAVAAACVWALLPIRRGVALWRRFGIVLFAAICWRSNRQLFLLTDRPGPGARNTTEDALGRWDCLRQSLPAGSVVGYVGSVPREKIAVDYNFHPRERGGDDINAYFRLLFAESALAPVVVVNRTDLDYVVADLDVADSAPATLMFGRYERLIVCPSGCVLYRRRGK